jgi:hypothetical protein
MDLGALEQARRHLARSIELSQAIGIRVGLARGLEAFATLAVREKQPKRAVQLAAAAAALRESAGVPPLPAPRTDSYLASARHLPADVAVAPNGPWQFAPALGLACSQPPEPEAIRVLR